MTNPSGFESRNGLASNVNGAFPVTYSGTPLCYSPAPPKTAVQQWISSESGKYQVRVAQSLAEREAACRLRFRVFNVELGEGLSSSYSTGMDQDEFDLFCDHLIVMDRSRNEIVGTYRMQSGAMARQNIGYYGAREFDFTPYERAREEVLELGRASIDSDHRSSEVLNLLWRGIARYAQFYGLRYLIGCSSLNSQDPQSGWTVFGQLSEFLVTRGFRTVPEAAYELPKPSQACEVTVKAPRLLKTYIGVGARICSVPAWDREFGTIDFLTLLDLTQLSPSAKARFMVETH